MSDDGKIKWLLRTYGGGIRLKEEYALRLAREVLGFGAAVGFLDGKVELYQRQFVEALRQLEMLMVAGTEYWVGLEESEEKIGLSLRELWPENADKVKNGEKLEAGEKDLMVINEGRVWHVEGALDSVLAVVGRRVLEEEMPVLAVMELRVAGGEEVLWLDDLRGVKSGRSLNGVMLGEERYWANFLRKRLLEM